MINSSTLTPVQDFYCCALRTLPIDPEFLRSKYFSLNDQELWEFSVREGASSIIGYQLIAVLGESETPPHWLSAVKDVTNRISLYMRQLDRASNALSQEGISLVALKNSGIARGLHTALATTPMGDVDVLVSPRDFSRAHNILTSLGFILDDRSPFNLSDIDQAQLHGGSEYRVHLSDGSELWFELQWRPVSGRWIRPDQEPSADELLDRSLGLPDTSVRILSPEDNLLQVCLHTAKHSFVRAPGFRLHSDVDRITNYCDINWDSFCLKVERLELSTAVYLSLIIPSILLSSRVPSSVLSRLNKSPLKNRFMLAWINRAGLFDPHSRKWSKLGYIFFNLLMYDSLSGVFRALFPHTNYMRSFYQPRSSFLLPYFYAKRILDLVFHRART